MRKKYKNRKKAQRRKEEEALSFSQFIERTNDRVVGRSPSVMPVMEELLRNAVRPAFLNQGQSVYPTGDDPVQAFRDENNFTMEFPTPTDIAFPGAPLRSEILAKVQDIHGRYNRTIPFLWYTILTVLILSLIPFIVRLQMDAVNMITTDLSQLKQQVPVESELDREMYRFYSAGEKARENSRKQTTGSPSIP
jgi:hypothetical protein